MATNQSPIIEGLPADNAARIAIYDALLLSASSSDEPPSLPADELFQRVIGRLRVLVPRELHLAGERTYFDEKIATCIEAGLLAQSDDDERLIRSTGTPPEIQYPNGVTQAYHAGLAGATERLDADNQRLQNMGFDVHAFVPSLADDPEGPLFKLLVDSMREHGYLKEFPIVVNPSGLVVDGRARQAAAAKAGVKVEKVVVNTNLEKSLARRRNTPLNRLLLALDANVSRLSTEERGGALAAASEVAGRSWDEIEADLVLTREWRRAAPPEYKFHFEVKRVRFRADTEEKVEVTADGKVGLRSLLREAGLPEAARDTIKPYAPFELATSEFSSGKRAIFVRASDLISGIGNLQSDRTEKKRPLAPEWGQIKLWLEEQFAPASGITSQTTDEAQET